MDEQSTMHPIMANLIILGMALVVVALLCLTGCTDTFTGADEAAFNDEAGPAHASAPSFAMLTS